MRIKDLATRATKLLTGNAWFVVDNGTKVEKAAYSEVVKQGIEEYAGSTLAGSAQTVKSAIDALNRNTVAPINTNVYTSNSEGQFNSLLRQDGTYAIYVSDSSGNYCYGQYTVKYNVSFYWQTLANSGITEKAANSTGTIVFQGGTAPYTMKAVRQTYTPSNATLESLNSKFFSKPYSDNVTTVTATFPRVDAGQVWLMNIKHYTSSNTVVNMLYVIAYQGNTWSFNQVTQYTTLGVITNITSSDKNVTFTFDKAVFCTIQFIAFI